MWTLIVYCAAILILFHCNAKEYEFTEENYKTIFPNNEDNGTLVLVNVLFRHGNRTPDGDTELYPTDPYLNFSYFPYGLGQLTNVGKLKEYTIGTTLRNRYNTFLGKFYYPNIVEAISSDYNRTKMSMQLVLAGLFPPRQEELVSTDLPWQPIPYNYLPRTEDKVLLGVYCPHYKELFDQYVLLPKIQNQFKRHSEIFEYLSNHTGLKINSFYDVYNLYFGLSTEEEFGLALPDWTKTVWPEPIYSLAVEEYFIDMGLPNMKKMSIGYLLEKILKNANEKINDNRKLSRKIHLYSGHESNIAHLLLSLGVFEKRVPPYGSYVILEWHKVNGTYGVKIFYNGRDGRGIRLMKMPQCREFCPLNVFQALISEYLPVDPNLCGD